MRPVRVPEVQTVRTTMSLGSVRQRCAKSITRRVPFEASAINAVLDELEHGTGHVRTVIEVRG